ncbi:MAG TPA: methyltransferase [Thermoanaerobaculia bacterium]|nr:methyltransferase [Thermoanaerobaculia bacterium]
MTGYRGWTRPGPFPPGGIDPEAGETLDYICGNFRIFQYASGHRYSTDDVLTAWYGTTCAPRVERAADLGSGIGSVAIIAAWRLAGARFVTVEAQEMSVRLARKSIRYNGLESRFTIRHGDLRDPAIFAGEAPFDLVLGSPPYFPPGTAVEAQHPQAVGARIEMRGSVADYEAAAERILAPGGVFAFVAPAGTRLQSLRLVRKREIIFKEGAAPLIAVFAASREEDIPPSYETLIESPLTIRRLDGSVDREYSAIRMSFGFPPGNVG